MKNNLILLILTLLVFPVYSQNEYPKDFFLNPVDFKIAIAGTFGELRSNHFHSGIDIKTKQKPNIPIHASQDGYISRIKVSTSGFGKALYINHPNGFTTVYAHLDRFHDKIQRKTEKKQYEKESFEIDFSLKTDEIEVKKGEVIGFSGNTGSSTAPHLHFEIRDTKTQKVINPMLFGLPILDRTHPIINSILIYHNNGKKELIKAKKVNNHQYKLAHQPNISGPFNIAINTFDLLDAAPNKNGVYSIELYVNDSLYFSNIMNTFSFSETRYINSHIDYEYYKNKGQKFQKCFLDLNNKISTNQKYTKKKIGQLSKINKHIIKIIIKDSYQNSSILHFEIDLPNNIESQYDENKTLGKESTINSKQVFEFQDDEFEIYIPNNSLYKDYPFKYEKIIDSLMTWPIYQILNDSIPSHKSFILSINASPLPIELREKTLIGRLSDDKIHCIQSKWKENAIIGKSNKFGSFSIVIDTVKPNIEYEQIKDNTMEFKISDDLSGIKNYRGEIDGKWILMEYDFKTDLLKYDFKELPKKKKQKLILSVTDHAKNTKTINIDFFR
tara:strand:+ start:4033 stop:5700 length:1668 start_codon:yes stop_codon:yes gene_type:complete